MAESHNNIFKNIFPEPVNTGVLVADLLLAVDRKTESRIRRNEYKSAVNLFKDFLGAKDFFNPDEALMDEFTGFLSNRYGTDKKQHRFCLKQLSIVRLLINSLPGLSRQLLQPRTYHRLKRNERYTPETIAIFEEYMASGWKTKRDRDGNIVKTTNLLAPCTRKRAVGCAKTVLDAINHNDIFFFSDEHIDALLKVYDQRGFSRDTPNHLLTDMHPLFVFMVTKGLIAKNPVAGIEKPRNINSDYVEEKGMNILLDLRTVDMNNFFDVRDRLITICIYYDFCLRNTEGSLLDVSDVRFNDFLEITVRKDVQEKKQNQREGVKDLVFEHYFSESVVLMKRYLELRHRRGSSSNALLLGDHGNRLGSSGCEDAVTRQCKNLNILTYSGEIPTCHRLRHSMCTLNVTPLGKEIELSQLQKRMRHTSIATTERVYKTNNPVLAKAEHKKWAERHNEHKRREPVQSKTQDAENKTMTETEAFALLRGFDIKLESLRKYAESKNALEKVSEVIFYSRTLIEHLSRDYFTKDEAMRMLNYKKSGLFYWIKSNGIEQVVIGNVMLIPQDDVINKKRKENKHE